MTNPTKSASSSPPGCADAYRDLVRSLLVERYGSGLGTERGTRRRRETDAAARRPPATTAVTARPRSSDGPTSRRRA